MNDKVHELVLPHLLEVDVGDEERDVLAFGGLATHYNELLGTLHQEPSELVAEDLWCVGGGGRSLPIGGVSDCESELLPP